MRSIEAILARLAELIESDRFETLESDTLEIKPVPSQGGQWREVFKSANAFLNARGGVILLGLTERGAGEARRYVFTRYHERAEAKLRELPKAFTDRDGRALDLTEFFRTPQLPPFLDGCVAIVDVDELPADRKFCFYRGEAYKRHLTGDHRIGETEIESQEDFKQEAHQARELLHVPGAAPDDLDLDRLNEYIQELNRTTKIETIKADLAAARAFLERKSFIKDGGVTLLGLLVCGRHPGDHLGFRAQVHGYVEGPNVIARDKQDFCDNILPLMQSALAYIMRNIHVGVSAAGGGAARPEYPEELLRETVNNALAHRDYSIDKQVIISIQPGRHVCITNPGAFRPHSLINSVRPPVLRRIIPEAKPRNPKLADVLRVYRKWEGRGIGMATLVNLCLDDRIDVPCYRLRRDEVSLFVRAGKLVDDRMERLFETFDKYLERKLNGLTLTQPQMRILAYLVKSEEANARERHTILLTHDNNHYDELASLEAAGLIHRWPDSPMHYPVYTVDRALMKQDFLDELREIFGPTFDDLNSLSKRILSLMYLCNEHSSDKRVSAKRASFHLWAREDGSPGDVKAFDRHYRQIRYTFNVLEESRFIVRKIARRRGPKGATKKKVRRKGGRGPTAQVLGYVLNKDYLKEHLV
jgi:predicted HTH transcriptional regulator